MISCELMDKKGTLCLVWFAYGVKLYSGYLTVHVITDVTDIHNLSQPQNGRRRARESERKREIDRTVLRRLLPNGGIPTASFSLPEVIYTSFGEAHVPCGFS